MRKRAQSIDPRRASEYERIFRKNRRVDSDKDRVPPPQKVKYWLFKANVYIDTFADLCNRENRTDTWNGVRQAQARNYIRDEMRIGDRVLFYHTGAGKPKKLRDCDAELVEGTVQSAVVGTAIIVSDARPDHTAWDPDNELFFDEEDDPENPKWALVDIQASQEFHRPVTLENIKQNPILQDFYANNFRRQPMVPIHPVTQKEWNEILRMGMEDNN